MLIPRLEVVVRPNQVSAKNLRSGQIVTTEGPFSCDHLLADDVDILEHVAMRALRQLGRVWFFPRVTVSTAGRPIHLVERKVIIDALTNAGASSVVLDSSVRLLDEQAGARAAYVHRAKATR